MDYFTKVSICSGVHTAEDNLCSWLIATMDLNLRKLKMAEILPVNFNDY